MISRKKLNIRADYLLILILIFFVFQNWINLINISNLAPPDFYKYYLLSEHLFSGHFALRKIPPVFPFLLGSYGRLFSVIPGISDPFIFGTRVISLISSMGVVFITFLFIKKIFNSIAAFVVSLALIASPFFLKFSTLPLTDMLFLFFVACSFYFIYSNKKWLSVLFITSALFTRYEGVLLLISYSINYFSFKTKKYIQLIIFFFLSLTVLFLFYINFGERLLKKINYIFASGSYLNFFRYPGRIVSLLMKNIVFFFNGSIDSVAGWIIILSLIFLFFYGLKTLFSLNKRFTWSLLFYLIVFTISKGYISGVWNVFNAESQARRMLSVIYIFWVITMLGMVKFVEKIKELPNNKIKNLIKFAILILLVLIVSMSPFPEKRAILISLILIFPVIFIIFYKIKMGKIEKTITAALLFVSFVSIFNYGYKKTYSYVKSLPNKGAFVLSQWADANIDTGEKLAVYSLVPMLKYYMKKDVFLIKPYTRIERIYRYRDLLAPFLAKKLKNMKVKYIATDFYMNIIDTPWLVAIKLMFFKSAKKGSDFFELHKRLFYKGAPVAMIFKLK